MLAAASSAPNRDCAEGSIKPADTAALSRSGRKRVTLRCSLTYRGLNSAMSLASASEWPCGARHVPPTAAPTLCSSFGCGKCFNASPTKEQKPEPSGLGTQNASGSVSITSTSPSLSRQRASSGGHHTTPTPRPARLVRLSHVFTYTEHSPSSCWKEI